MTKAVAVLLIPAALFVAAARRGDAVAVRRRARLPLLALALLYVGHLGDLWEWNVAYNADYASALSLGDRIERLRGQSASLLLIAVAAVAAAALWVQRARHARDAR